MKDKFPELMSQEDIDKERRGGSHALVYVFIATIAGWFLFGAWMIWG